MSTKYAYAVCTAQEAIRIGSALTQELQPQLDALEAHGIGRDKTFSEKISTRHKVRPEFERPSPPPVYEMKRLGRDAASSPPAETERRSVKPPWSAWTPQPATAGHPRVSFTLKS
ncbi:hypothetical protein [Nonomuraea turkmeniaca]|uniref:hypothetical protein n=1 Tax=Nonomuraea turkmeniaca TaxID=103838 RepID=UPI001B875D67|nr:hypothetical protein [Nonomuraea turkmeniaca]